MTEDPGESARQALRSWRTQSARRDSVVRAALDAGLSKEEIHVLSGLGRNTIDRIVKKKEASA